MPNDDRPPADWSKAPTYNSIDWSPVLSHHLQTKYKIPEAEANRWASNVTASPDIKHHPDYKLLREAQQTYPHGVPPSDPEPDYDPRAAREAEYQHQQDVAKEFALRRAGKIRTQTWDEQNQAANPQATPRYMPPPPPEAANLNLGVLGSTMTGLMKQFNMVPEVASAVTRMLYAPAMNHPKMQELTRAVQAKVGAITRPAANAVGGAAQAAGAAPQQTIPMPTPMIPALRNTAATLHVLMGAVPQKTDIGYMDADDINAAVNQGDNDDSGGFTGAVRDGVNSISDAF